MRQKLSRIEEWAAKNPSVKLRKRDEREIEWEKQWIETGAGTDWKNFQNYWIEGDSLHFSFAPYQVAGYAEGFFFCAIPISKLEPLMRPEIVNILKR